jgi:hypothetical protein
MPDHSDLIRERNLERAALIVLLSEARHLLQRADIWVEYGIKRDAIMDKGQKTHPAQSIHDDIQKFLDAGIFGDKQEVKP